MKQMEVTIMGQSYVLGCPPGGESALMAAVARVDREMALIRESGKVKARERIAVLAALNLAFVRPVDTPPEPVEAAPPPVAVSSPAPEPAQASLPIDAPASSFDLEALIRRIDERLGGDSPRADGAPARA